MVAELTILAQDGRLLGLSSALGADVRQSLTYGYSASDEITAITNAVNSGLTYSYTHDKLSRLTAVAASNANSFGCITIDKRNSMLVEQWEELFNALGAESRNILSVSP